MPEVKEHIFRTGSSVIPFAGDEQVALNNAANIIAGRLQGIMGIRDIDLYFGKTREGYSVGFQSIKFGNGTRDGALYDTKVFLIGLLSGAAIAAGVPSTSCKPEVSTEPDRLGITLDFKTVGDFTQLASVFERDWRTRNGASDFKSRVRT